MGPRDKSNIMKIIRFYISIFFFSIFFINVIAIPIPDLATAQKVAQGIADDILPTSGLSRLEACVERAILRDHSRANHPMGRSYFRTSNRDRMRRIANEIITRPTNYSVDWVDTFPNFGPLVRRERLTLIKTFTYDESQRLIHRDHIGYNTAGNKTNTAKIILDITNVGSAAEYHLGAAITGFPY